MTIKPGEKLPDIELPVVDADGIRPASIREVFAGKKAILFGLPGAFTSTCSKSHLPGFVREADALREAGAELVACVSVNDAAVMKAWAKDQGVGDAVLLIADGNAAFTKAVGLEVDLSMGHMGVRSQRYAAIVDDGVVQSLHVEKPREFEVSSAEAMLAALRAG